MPTEKEPKYDPYEREKALAKRIAGVAGMVVAVIVALNLLFGSFYTVEQGERGIHTRMGAIVDISEPGMHLKFPFIDAVKRFSIRTQTTKWMRADGADSRMESYSNDQQPADISMVVNWSPQTDERSIVSAYTKYGSVQGMQNALIVPSTQEGFKNIFGRYTSVTAIQKRAILNAEVAGEVLRLTKDYPIKIESVQVQDIAFSDAYEEAVEARMTAQVNVERKTQEKLTAQINADMQVIGAEAEAKATKLQGDAEAGAIKAKADALAQNARLVEYTAAQRWDGKLPETMVPGGAVPMLNLAR